ncbi:MULTISPECIES: SDR family oxidoreductase [unclassified Thiocapsa]|uniref:SDR family oxidoreductase n=1 Tax=unclassified Thiocapsa TaxID=2641286 RepID=UPI0035B01B1A
MNEQIVVGCGYVGMRLARQYREQGEAVTCIVRSDAGVARLEHHGIQGLRCDLAAENLGDLGLAEARVFHFAPPPGNGVQDPHTRHLVEVFERYGHPRRVLYISTTGVYGDCAGSWIDETHPVAPVAARSQRRRDAEETLLRWCAESGRDLVILRVAGIYGPDRLPLERIRAGAPLVRPQEAPYTNRIHVDDLVTACIAAMERAPSGAIYNACDGHPSTMTDYFLDVAAAAGLPSPPLISLAEAADRLSEGMLSYLSESRRLRNDRLREELGVVFRYPSLAEGLRGLF